MCIEDRIADIAVQELKSMKLNIPYTSLDWDWSTFDESASVWDGLIYYWPEEKETWEYLAVDSGYLLIILQFAIRVNAALLINEYLSIHAELDPDGGLRKIGRLYIPNEKRQQGRVFHSESESWNKLCAKIAHVIAPRVLELAKAAGESEYPIRIEYERNWENPKRFLNLLQELLVSKIYEDEFHSYPWGLARIAQWIHVLQTIPKHWPKEYLYLHFDKSDSFTMDISYVKDALKVKCCLWENYSPPYELDSFNDTEITGGWCQSHIRCILAEHGPLIWDDRVFKLLDQGSLSRKKRNNSICISLLETPTTIDASFWGTG
jgi:hypothetical protein